MRKVKNKEPTTEFREQSSKLKIKNKQSVAQCLFWTHWNLKPKKKKATELVSNMYSH